MLNEIFSAGLLMSAIAASTMPQFARGPHAWTVERPAGPLAHAKNAEAISDCTQALRTLFFCCSIRRRKGIGCGASVYM